MSTVFVAGCGIARVNQYCVSLLHFGVILTAVLWCLSPWLEILCANARSAHSGVISISFGFSAVPVKCDIMVGCDFIEVTFSE